MRTKAENTAYHRAYRAKNADKMREYHREYKRKQRKQQPELSAHYSAKWRERDATRPRPFMCEICDKPGKVVWDHCHKTGLFRGWVCLKCNTALGLVDDCHDRMQRMMKYLDRFQAVAEKQKKRTV